MPSRDSTGPQGSGPRTGRGFGVCKPKLDEDGKPIEPQGERGAGNGNRPRRGRGMGGGRGRGPGRR